MATVQFIPSCPLFLFFNKNHNYNNFNVLKNDLNEKSFCQKAGQYQHVGTVDYN